MNSLQITQCRVDNAIELTIEDDGFKHTLAELYDGDDNFTFDDMKLNGTRAILGKPMIDAVSAVSDAGLDVTSVRLIDAMPNRDSDK